MNTLKEDPTPKNSHIANRMVAFDKDSRAFLAAKIRLPKERVSLVMQKEKT
jgi:hypothetical protein